ncbi:MAG: thymidine kinase [Oceanospirillaceae bacterium]|nr:thymidine kinase [Oceanospirillaceae bacterium]
MAQLYFYYSAMNAGKSTSLLQSSHNYTEQGMQVLLFTAAVDERVEKGVIASRIGLRSDALVFEPDTQLYTQINEFFEKSELHCVFVDEAQFLSRDQVDQLARVVDRLNIPVLCYGIRSDFQGELFPGSQRLLNIADKLTELKAVCHCGRKATMVVRRDAQGNTVSAGEQVVIGGNDSYESMCRNHFFLSVGTY